MRLLFLALLTTLVSASYAQSVINKYAAVINFDVCNSVLVDNATDFNVGDTVLIIQMKGAVIDSNNNAQFGNVLSYGDAGNFELNIIASKNANYLALKYVQQKSYDPVNGKVQLVRVPYYQNYTVSAAHTCMAWNGQKGGVFAINVANTLTVDNSITVSNRGFQGGQPNSATTYSCNYTDYFYALGTNNGGVKGEGIATLSAARMRGMGKLGNGGGGGNNTNSGGGGGSNAGAGGIGGRQWESCDINLLTGGIGGDILTYSPASGRIFMGGGGGVGHENNTDTDPGGNGGGIVLIMAGNIAGSGTIAADGGNCIDVKSLPPSSGDGQSGGGGGGAVLILAGSVTGITIRANGGNGGNIFSAGQHGPGGGGSGGAVLFSSATVPSVTINTWGGANGKNNPSNNTWNSQPGTAGQVISNFPYTFPTTLFSNSGITGFDTIKLCAGQTYSFGGQTIAAPGTYQHTFKLPTGCDSLATLTVLPGAAVSNAVSTILCPGQTYNFGGQIIAAPGTYQHTFILSTGCDSLVTLTVLPGTVVNNAISTVLCPGTTYTFAGQTISDTGVYTHTFPSSSGCDSIVTLTVEAGITPYANFIHTPVPPEMNVPTSFTNMSLDATILGWDFGDGSGSSEKDPQHIYVKSGTYKVCLTATNIDGCTDELCKDVEALVYYNIDVPTGFSPNGDGHNDLLFVKGIGVKEMLFRVYNRWGQLVFETKSLDVGWNGSYNGKKQDMEVFGYTLHAILMDGTTIEKSGNVTMVR